MKICAGCQVPDNIKTKREVKLYHVHRDGHYMVGQIYGCGGCGFLNDRQRALDFFINRVLSLNPHEANYRQVMVEFTVPKNTWLWGNFNDTYIANTSTVTNVECIDIPIQCEENENMEEHVMNETVSVEKLIAEFEGMANRETLLARGGVTQKDLLMQIIGTIVKVAMDEGGIL